jgi:threonine dehydrogenase-like Zn-dependent dehydrogenase
MMVHHYSACGDCKYCRAGYGQHCIHGSIAYGWEAHGGHAEYMLLKHREVVPMPDGLDFDEGAAIACGTGTAYVGVRRLDLSAGDTVAIFGQGPVGLSATMFAKALGARVVACDFSAERLELARAMGADETFDASAVDPVQTVRDLTGGDGADATMDCTGEPAARVNALQSARIWGRVAFIGEGNPTRFNVSRDILRRQLTVHGSWTFGKQQMAECAAFVVERELPLKRLLTHRYALENAAEAYRLFDTKSTGKGMLLP